MEDTLALQSGNGSAKCKFYRPNRISASLMTLENYLYLYPGSKDIFQRVCCKQSVSCAWDPDQMLAFHFSNYSFMVPAQTSLHTQFRD